jgi:hypothetical protein
LLLVLDADQNGSAVRQLTKLGARLDRDAVLAKIGPILNILPTPPPIGIIQRCEDGAHQWFGPA